MHRQSVLIDVVRDVEVRGDRTPQEMFNTADCGVKLINPEVFAGMPVGTVGNKKVIFFWVPSLSDTGLKLDFTSRGLEPVDPRTLAAVNEADQKLAKDFPNITHWQNAEGKWCYAMFRWNDMERRSVYVCQSDGPYAGVWAAGVVHET